MLKLIFGILKNCRAYGMLNPICEIGNPGRYLSASGKYLAAQHPSTIRSFQDFDCGGGTLLIVSAIRRMILSESLSSWPMLARGVLWRKCVATDLDIE